MKADVRSVARMGRISYINCLPFYHRLLENESSGTPPFEVYEAYPSKINLAVRSGKIHMAPVSSLEYANHRDRYMLFPGIAIGARDFSGSVLLFSKERIENLNHKTIALSRQSLSSATLLKILLKFKYKFSNKFISSNMRPTEMFSKADAALIIGDDALFYKPEEFVYKYDLSELWWNWTERPFCFAVWAVRRDFAEKCPDEARFFAKELKATAERNLSDIERLLKESLRISFLDADFPKVYGYFFNLNYHLDKSLIEGLELFYRLAYRLGVSPRPKPIEFLN